MMPEPDKRFFPTANQDWQVESGQHQEVDWWLKNLLQSTGVKHGPAICHLQLGWSCQIKFLYTKSGRALSAFFFHKEDKATRQLFGILSASGKPAMYESTTKDIKVIVRPQYLVEQSKPQDSYFVWSYTVLIENKSQTTVTLRTRYWQITDDNGRVQEVRGEGVVGEQPVIKPGESFKYSSGAPLATPSGFMSGSYQMEAADGASFDVEIPAFSLDQPTKDGALH